MPQPLYRKILLTFVPKQNWIILLVAVLFSFLGNQFLNLAYFGFNYFLLMISLKLAIIIHEIGHLLFARLVGGIPRRMTIGKGNKIWEYKLFRVNIILKTNINSGLAYSAFDDLKFIRLKLLISNSGGFLTNILVSGTLFMLFNFSTKAFYGIHFISVIILSNVIIAGFALIPYYTNYKGVIVSSDGLSILKIPFLKKTELIQLSFANEFLDALEYYESKNFEQAKIIYENYRSKTLESKSANLSLSIIYLKLGRFNEALELLEELLPILNEKQFSSYKIIIHNALAWHYLLLDEIEKADKFSKLAFMADSTTKEIIGTRASILIELGEYDRGKNILIDNLDFNYTNNITFTAAIYLSLAYHKLGEEKQAIECYQFIEENVDSLDLDEKHLFQRVKEQLMIIIPE